MEKRQLGNTDLYLTTVGLGTWAIGGPWQFGWGPQDDRDSERAIEEAVEQGINWIDTAPAYGLGHSEEVVGGVLRRHRDRLTIATKCGRVWDDASSGSIYGRLTADSVRAECEASLRRLGVDVIDMYQIHWPDPEARIEEAWETMARLKEEGKIRYPGVSNFSVEQMRRVQRIHPIASLQPPYSMLRRGIEEDILPFCAENGIGVVVYSPMQAGLLTGKYDRAAIEDLPDDDWRHGNRHFRDPQLAANLEVVEGLRPIAERNGRSLAELAVAWTLRRPEVTSAIVGARKPGQIAQTAGASGWTLSPGDVEAIDALLEERDRALESVS